jgi:uncharacterized protein
MRVVLDTNVILSAILFGGKPRRVLQAAISGTITICTSDPIIQELSSVLERPRFGLDANAVQGIISELASLSELVSPRRHFHLIDEDPSDNLFIDCAVEARAEYIVSGDRHLIVSPETFLTILESA